jgi:hypothetical protein
MQGDISSGMAETVEGTLARKDEAAGERKEWSGRIIPP